MRRSPRPAKAVVFRIQFLNISACMQSRAGPAGVGCLALAEPAEAKIKYAPGSVKWGHRPEDAPSNCP